MPLKEKFDTQYTELIEFLKVLSNPSYYNSSLASTDKINEIVNLSSKLITKVQEIYNILSVSSHIAKPELKKKASSLNYKTVDVRFVELFESFYGVQLPRLKLNNGQLVGVMEFNTHVAKALPLMMKRKRSESDVRKGTSMVRYPREIVNFLLQTVDGTNQTFLDKWRERVHQNHNKRMLKNANVTTTSSEKKNNLTANIEVTMVNGVVEVFANPPALKVLALIPTFDKITEEMLKPEESRALANFNTLVDNVKQKYENEEKMKKEKERERREQEKKQKAQPLPEHMPVSYRQELRY